MNSGFSTTQILFTAMQVYFTCVYFQQQDKNQPNMLIIGMFDHFFIAPEVRG